MYSFHNDYEIEILPEIEISGSSRSIVVDNASVYVDLNEIDEISFREQRNGDYLYDITPDYNDSLLKILREKGIERLEIKIKMEEIEEAKASLRDGKSVVVEMSSLETAAVSSEWKSYVAMYEAQNLCSYDLGNIPHPCFGCDFYPGQNIFVFLQEYEDEEESKFPFSEKEGKIYLDVDLCESVEIYIGEGRYDIGDIADIHDLKLELEWYEDPDEEDGEIVCLLTEKSRRHLADIFCERCPYFIEPSERIEIY